MKNQRTPQDGDPEKIKAILSVIHAMVMQSEYEHTLFISAFMTLITRAHHFSGLTYEEFCQEIDYFRDDSKKYWEQENNGKS